MEDLLQIMLNRRSVRNYSGEEVPEEAVRTILKAGLIAESNKNTRPWEMIVVRDKVKLKTMANCRTKGAELLARADVAIAVFGNPEITDVWVEDCAIVLAHMHLMADAIGIGSCWVQARNRRAVNGQSTDNYLKDLLGTPKHWGAVGILALGMPAMHPSPHTEDDMDWTKVHQEMYHVVQEKKKL